MSRDLSETRGRRLGEDKKEKEREWLQIGNEGDEDEKRERTGGGGG